MRSLLLVLVGCSENRLHVPDPVAPAEPPGETLDAFGNAPDWATCSEAYYGQYFNLTDDAEALAIGEEGPEAVEPEDVGWWDAENLSFHRADTSLVMGSSWWPVDEGLEGDPENFAVRWTAWARSVESGDVVLALTAATDAWVYLGDDLVAVVEAAPEAQSASFTVPVRSGVYPLDIRFAQRVPRESAFRFRVVSGEMVVCYPDFSVEDSEN